MNSVTKKIVHNLLYESMYVLCQDPMITSDPIAIVDSIQHAEELMDERTLGESEPLVVEGVLVPANLLLPKMLNCKDVYLVCIEDEDLTEFMDINGLLDGEGVIAKGRLEPISIEDIKTLATAQNINEVEALGAVVETFIEMISTHMDDTYILLGYEQKLSLCIDTDQIDDSAMEVPLAIGKLLNPSSDYTLVNA